MKQWLRTFTVSCFSLSNLIESITEIKQKIREISPLLESFWNLGWLYCSFTAAREERWTMVCYLSVFCSPVSLKALRWINLSSNMMSPSVLLKGESALKSDATQAVIEDSLLIFFITPSRSNQERSFIQCCILCLLVWWALLCTADISQHCIPATPNVVQVLPSVTQTSLAGTEVCRCNWGQQ